MKTESAESRKTTRQLVRGQSQQKAEDYWAMYIRNEPKLGDDLSRNTQKERDF